MPKPSRSRFALLMAFAAIVLTSSVAQGQSSGGWYDKARAGTWKMDAGTVDFRIQGGSLDLRSAKANSGWKKRVSADKKDEIEVYFTKGNAEKKFEVELDDNRLEISKERDKQPVQGGTFVAGDAAEVKVSINNGSLSLDNIDTKDGWKTTSRDESSDDIEIDFKEGKQTAEFEIERSKGQTRLEVSQKVTGPAPS